MSKKRLRLTTLGGKVTQHTPQQWARLRVDSLKLYRQGYSTVMINRVNGVCVATIAYWVSKAGLTRSRPEAASRGRLRWENEERRRMAKEEAKMLAITLYNQGMRVPDISKRIGYHQSPIYAWLRDSKTVRKRHEGRRLQFARKRKMRTLHIQSLIEQGYKAHQMAPIVGCVDSTVYSILRTLPKSITKNAYTARKRWLKTTCLVPFCVTQKPSFKRKNRERSAPIMEEAVTAA